MGMQVVYEGYSIFKWPVHYFKFPGKFPALRYIPKPLQLTLRGAFLHRDTLVVDLINYLSRWALTPRYTHLSVGKETITDGTVCQ